MLLRHLAGAFDLFRGAPSSAESESQTLLILGCGWKVGDKERYE